MSAAKRIGGDWVETVDPASQKVYYANVVTKEVSWTYPAELGKAAGASASAAPKAEDIWVERQDPKSGRTYYYNQATKERTWNRPKAATVVAQDGASASSADGWTERVDPASGRTYYYHKVTKERKWHLPGSEEETAAKAVASTTSSRKSIVGGAGEAADTLGALPSVSETPPVPSDYIDGRQSVRLGADGLKGLKKKAAAPEAAAETSQASESTPATEDRFAKLRALAKTKGMGSTTDFTEVALEAANTAVESDQQGNPDEIDVDKLAFEYSAGINFYSMEEYVKDNFNLKRKGLFGKQTTVSKILNWKEELIKKALHPMPDRTVESEAVQAFKNIVSYMGERKSSKDDIGHATKLLSNTVHAPEILRDEIFCQLIKQTRGNPDPESTVKGWQLMAITAGTFPPSKKLEKYLMSYCDENTKDVLSDGTKVHPAVKPFARYCMVRLKKSQSLGPRREVPTAMEIQAAKERKPVVIRVHLLNGLYKTVPAECWTTVRDLNQMVAKKLKIVDATPFATFEVSSNDEERVLDEDDRVLDLLSYWQREFGHSKKGKSAPTFQFIYKMRLFFDIADTDSAAIDLAYMQAVHDVTDSRYPCNEDDCLTLAALQAQDRFGDLVPGSSPFKEEGLGKFLPAKYLKSPERLQELEESILKTYAKLKGYSQTEAKLNYLDYVKSWKIYGSTYFFVEPQSSRDFPSDVVLAINSKGILVVDPETKDFLAEYPYSEVVTWGHSAQTFVLVVGNLIRQTKIYFRSDQGVEMNSLVHAYVNKLLDREA